MIIRRRHVTQLGYCHIYFKSLALNSRVNLWNVNFVKYSTHWLRHLPFNVWEETIKKCFFGSFSFWSLLWDDKSKLEIALCGFTSMNLERDIAQDIKGFTWNNSQGYGGSSGSYGHIMLYFLFFISSWITMEWTCFHPSHTAGQLSSPTIPSCFHSQWVWMLRLTGL